MPDAEFVVYGVSDDQWERSPWPGKNAPANNHTGGGADVSEAVELGSFMIPQGIYSGEVGVEGDSLAKFLLQEKNGDGMVTFLVVRRTGEIRRGGGLVHAFASNVIPMLPHRLCGLRWPSDRKLSRMLECSAFFAQFFPFTHSVNYK